MSLDHVKVLDIGGFITAPLASSMLADLGADVIKVERPKTGDPFRAFLSGLYSPYFCAMNWNKRSISIDLQKPEGIGLFKELAARADVIVENFRPGTTKRLGIDYATLRVINPRIIYCSITGFGPSGPYRDRPSYDGVAQAMSGYLSLLMDFSDPWVPNPGIGDQMTGIYAAYGMLGALLEREKTNAGRLVDITMLDSMLAFAAPYFAIAESTKELPTPESRAMLSQAYMFKCADEKVVLIHLSSPEQFWLNLLKALNRPDLGEDPRFNKRHLRMKSYQSLKAELGEVFRTKPRDEWVDLLQQNDVPCAPAYTLDEVRRDPQVKHLDSFAEYSHPREGPALRVRRPVYFDGTRDEHVKVPPALGEHNEAILRELGKSTEDIAHLRQQEIV